MRLYSKLLGLALALSFSVAGAQTLGPPGGGSGGAPTGAAGGSLTGTYPNPGLNLAGTNTGVLPAVNGGTGEAGTITGALKGNGTSPATQAACADLSNATGYCSATFLGAPASWTIASGTTTAAASQVISVSGSPVTMQLFLEQLDPAVTAADILIQLNADTAANYQYAFSIVGVAGTVTGAGNGGAQVTSCKIGTNIKAGYGSRSTVTLNDPLNVLIFKHINFQTTGTDTTLTQMTTQNGGCFWASSAAVTSITVLTSTGNIGSMKYQLVGYK